MGLAAFSGLESADGLRATRQRRAAIANRLPKWIWAADDNALTNADAWQTRFPLPFTLNQKPKSATLLITAKDNLAAWINGKQVLVESPMGNFGRARDPWG